MPRNPRRRQRAPRRPRRAASSRRRPPSYRPSRSAQPRRQIHWDPLDQQADGSFQRRSGPRPWDKLNDLVKADERDLDDLPAPERKEADSWLDKGLSLVKTYGPGLLEAGLALL
jgi:hypothetical protein